MWFTRICAVAPHLIKICQIKRKVPAGSKQEFITDTDLLAGMFLANKGNIQ
jgi:hypothetical protein